MVRSPVSRRALLSGSAALLAAGGLGSTLGAEESSPAWPMHRYDAGGTAHSPEGTIPRSKPTISWEQTSDTAWFTETGPILADDRVFHLGGKWTLRSFDADTGDLQAEIGGQGVQFGSKPAVAPASAYLTPSLVAGASAGYRAVGMEGGPDLPLIEADRFSRRWQQPDDPSVTLSVSPVAPPAVADDTVFVPLDGLAAIDASSGRIRWQKQFGSYNLPAVAEGRVFTDHTDGSVRAFDAASGSELWRESVPGGFVTAQPVATDGRVFVANDTHLTVLDAATGDHLWSERVSDARLEHPPAVTPSGLYLPAPAGGSGVQNRIVALETDSGDQLWHAPVRSVRDNEPGPVVADGVLLYPDGYSLVALDAANGERLWTHEFEGDLSQPAVGADRIYVATSESVFALGGS